MMKKMENGETVIGMLRHVIIGLRYRSCECTPSWTSDDEEEYTEVTEKYWRKRWTKRSTPNTCLLMLTMTMMVGLSQRMMTVEIWRSSHTG